jgi:hypothetical protein
VFFDGDIYARDVGRHSGNVEACRCSNTPRFGVDIKSWNMSRANWSERGRVVMRIACVNVSKTAVVCHTDDLTDTA